MPFSMLRLATFVTLSTCSYAAYENIPMSRLGVAEPSSQSLLPWTLTPLPLGTIKPSGWLKAQLQLMSDGLAGHSADFYNYVAHSSWLGGDMEYSDLNEGFPYWLNGLVPLAYALDDERLKSQVHSAAGYVLAHQTPDGWLGPENVTSRNFWARYPLCLGLLQLVEANATWEVPVLDGLHRFVGLMHGMLADNYTGYIYHEGDTTGEGDNAWGQVRAQDMIIALQWLYEKDPRNNSQVLLDNMQYLYDASYKWEAWYNEAVYLKQDLYTVDPSIANQNYQYIHGVNVGQGLKAPAVIRRFTHNDSLLSTAATGVNWTFLYHGAASGTVLADERQDGLSPYSGSELCTAVETMYSLSYLYQSLGTALYADRAELAAFNALPAMLTPDWWAHQYMAQPNQPYSRNLTQSPFSNVSPWAQTFGLEPHYPCCTVNHPQGYPKFLSAMFATVGDTGIAHALLGPAIATVPLTSGALVTINCTTNYPFADQLSYTITAPDPFDFYIRVPAWANTSTSYLHTSHSPKTPLAPDPTTALHKLSLPAGTTTLTYHLSTSIRLEPRANNTVSIHHGALLYALDIPSTNTSTPPRYYTNYTEYPADYAPPQSRDWTFTNTSAWNIAIDPSTLVLHTRAGSDVAALPNLVWEAGAPPRYMTARGCEVEWPLFRGSVPGPVPVDGRTCVGKVKKVRLVPYASTRLRMAELPVMDLKGL